MQAETVSIVFCGDIATPFRFRYNTEGESASGKLHPQLPNSQVRTKSPLLRLKSSYKGDFAVFANCVTATDPAIPHPNFLIGGKNHCTNGVFQFRTQCDANEEKYIELDCGVQGVKKEGFLQRYEAKLKIANTYFNPLCQGSIPDYHAQDFFKEMNMNQVRVYVSVYQLVRNSAPVGIQLQFVCSCISNILEHSAKAANDAAEAADLRIVALEPANLSDTGGSMAILFNLINQIDPIIPDQEQAATGKGKPKQKKPKAQSPVVEVYFSNNTQFQHDVSVGHWCVSGEVISSHHAVAVIVQVPEVRELIAQCAPVASGAGPLLPDTPNTRAFVSLVCGDKLSEAREICFRKHPAQQMHELAEERRRKIPSKNLKNQYTIPKPEGHSGGVSPATLQAVQQHIAASNATTRNKAASMQQPTTSQSSNNSLMRKNDSLASNAPSSSYQQPLPRTQVPLVQPQPDILQQTLANIDLTDISCGVAETSHNQFLTDAARLSGAGEKTLNELWPSSSNSTVPDELSSFSLTPYDENSQLGRPFSTDEDFDSDDNATKILHRI